MTSIDSFYEMVRIIILIIIFVSPLMNIYLLFKNAKSKIAKLLILFIGTLIYIVILGSFYISLFIRA